MEVKVDIRFYLIILKLLNHRNMDAHSSTRQTQLIPIGISEKKSLSSCLLPQVVHSISYGIKVVLLILPFVVVCNWIFPSFLRFLSKIRCDA